MRLIFTVLEKLPDGKYRIKVEEYSDGKEVTECDYIDPGVIGDMLEVNPNIKVGDEIVLDGEYKIVTLKSPNRQARILARADTDFNAYLKGEYRMRTIEETWTFEGDMLFKNTPAPELGENISRRQLMMTKEVFRECFMRWLVLKGGKADVGEEEDK